MRRTLPLILAFAVLVGFGGLPVSAQTSAAPDVPLAKRPLSDQLDAMRFRCIGPYRGGRVTAVTGVRGAPYTFYQGATGGGVWRTDDGGDTWAPLSDKDFHTGSVGAVAVAESDPNVVYVGMGEAPIRGNVSHGDGVYTSTDRGRTWQHVGLERTYQISRIRVHPRDANLVYVAAQGHVWGPNPERGIFRSKDGGKTWERVLFVSENTGASDLCMDPTNPRILYAGFWQVHRTPWSLESGGTEGGLYRSTDGGDTWKKLAGGLPEGVVGNVGVAVSPARPDRVWAMVEAKAGGLYRTDDGGTTWTLVNSENKLRQRAWYYTKVYADPKSADTVYVLNVGMNRSADGGKTFTGVATPHGDNHDLWIDPDEPLRMIEGNDGGANVTFNGGQSWSTIMNQPTAQFYRVATDERTPYRIYGAQQDNSTIAIASRGRDNGIGEADWYDVGGGESGYVVPKRDNPDIVYAGSYGGYVSRYDHATRQVRNVTPWPQLAIGQAPKDLRYRFQWNAPIATSPHDPKVLYSAAQVLLKSTDEGQSWKEISPDLTRNDPSKQGASGGPITKDNTGIEVYDTIFNVVESPHEAGTIWVGTDDGLVQLTRDGGATWKNVTPKGMPEWIQVNAIEVSPHDKATAYVAATMYKHDDFRPFLFKTNDYGATWTRIDTGIRGDAFTRVVREDPERRGLLFVGTETGLYLSLDDGTSWQPFQRNLPIVPITDLAFKNGDLVVATQGRAFWVLDDLTPLHDLARAGASGGLWVYPPRAVYRWDSPNTGEPDEETPSTGVGANPPNGVVVYYWLDATPAESDVVKVDFLDGDTVLRSYARKKKDADADDERSDDVGRLPEPKAGLNRVVWDMRVARPSLLPRAIIWGDSNGPRVSPGTYAVRFTLGGTVVTKPVVIAPNPAVRVSTEDLRAQFVFLRELRDRLTETHRTVRQIRDVRAQVTAVVGRATTLGTAGPLQDLAKSLDEKFAAIERKLVNPDIKSGQDVLNFPPALDHQIVGIVSAAASADAAPTDAEVAYAKDVRARLAAVLAELRTVYDTDLAAFNAAVRAQNVPPVVAGDR